MNKEETTTKCECEHEGPYEMCNACQDNFWTANQAWLEDWDAIDASYAEEVA